MPTAKVTVTFRLDPAVHAGLVKAVAKAGVTKEAWVQNAIVSALRAEGRTP